MLQYEGQEERRREEGERGRRCIEGDDARKYRSKLIIIAFGVLRGRRIRPGEKEEEKIHKSKMRKTKKIG